MQLHHKLEDFGLHGKKAIVYQAVLELGKSTAQEIAKKSGVQRTTTYDVLDHLVREGLISTTFKGRTSLYVAEPPAKLLYNLQEKEKKLARFLPELELLFNVHSVKPRVRFYEGVEGIKTVYEDTLTVKDKQLRGLLSMQDLFEIPGKEYMEKYVERRIATGIKLKVIRPETKEVEEIWPTSAAELRELRFASRGTEFGMTMYVYDGKVSLIATKKENFGMIIESADFFQIQKQFFDVMWGVSRSTPRKS